MAKIKSAKVILAAAVLLIVFIPPFAKYQRLKHKNRMLEEKISALKEDNRRLAEKQVLLETDINYVERKAREKIGVVRKGEIVIKER